MRTLKSVKLLMTESTTGTRMNTAVTSSVGRIRIRENSWSPRFLFSPARGWVLLAFVIGI